MTGWSMVMPVKRLDQAKSRLRATLPAAPGQSAVNKPAGAAAPAEPDDWHARVALAMALDTVAATLASGWVDRVIVVTDDPVATAALGGLGAICVPDLPGAGLNPALRHGASVAAALAAADGHGRAGTAALGADLPALRTAELDAALVAVERLAARAYVPDAVGSGTTLLAAPAGLRLEPEYGPGSAPAHARSGAAALPGGDQWCSLRQDVDTAADLAAAQLLGLGPRTAAVLSASLAATRCFCRT